MERELLIKVLNKKEMKDGVARYTYIMDNFHKTNVTSDTKFQKTFNRFYRLRLPKSELYPVFFEYLQSCKTAPKDFETVYNYLCSKTGRNEFSFSTKLVATLNPDMPIYDKQVKTNIHLIDINNLYPKRCKDNMVIYQTLCDIYNTFLATDEAKEWIALFDEAFPGNAISNLKKIDFILWQL